MNYIKHETAIIDEGATIGEKTRIWHWVHICAGARIGERCSFGQNVFVGSDVVIGNNVKVQNNVSIYDAVTLEDNVFCGPSMVFTNVYNPRSAVSRKSEYRPTLVKHDATLGANCTIILWGYRGRIRLCWRRRGHYQKCVALRTDGRCSCPVDRLDESLWCASRLAPARAGRGKMPRRRPTLPP